MGKSSIQLEPLQTGRNERLRARLCVAEETSPALIVVHGLGDHLGRYEAFALDMQHHGISTLLFDLPGHGTSPRDRRDGRSFDGLMSDLAEVQRTLGARLPKAPQWMLGHSMGGNLALNYVLRGDSSRPPDGPAIPLQGLILCAPMLLPPRPPRRPHIFAAWLTGHLFPWLTVQRRVQPERLTGDPEEAHRIRSDDRMHGRITLYLATQLLSQGRWALDHARQLQLPTLILVGSDDELIDLSACEHLAIRAGEHAQLRSFTGMRHDLFHDRESSSVVTTITAWLKHASGEHAKEPIIPSK